ncbi:DUF6713 family protein [Gracilimonas mengyeensis]|uniref:DUF6713 family protein n=1 Tax=Gracilimonas mengyeensis TaxID=1302730 RepID=UPI003CCC6347
MTALIDFTFYIALSGFIAHELDAVHKKEWRLLFVLRNMEEYKARSLFIILHVPLFSVLFWLVTHPDASIKFWSVIGLDVFLIIHAGLHWRLSSHPDYDFNTFKFTNVYLWNFNIRNTQSLRCYIYRELSGQCTHAITTVWLFSFLFLIYHSNIFAAYLLRNAIISTSITNSFKFNNEKFRYLFDASPRPNHLDHRQDLSEWFNHYFRG